MSKEIVKYLLEKNLKRRWIKDFLEHLGRDKYQSQTEVDYEDKIIEMAIVTRT